jgi:hypothetical protein
LRLHNLRLVLLLALVPLGFILLKKIELAWVLLTNKSFVMLGLAPAFLACLSCSSRRRTSMSSFIYYWISSSMSSFIILMFDDFNSLQTSLT